MNFDLIRVLLGLSLQFNLFSILLSLLLTLLPIYNLQTTKLHR